MKRRYFVSVYIYLRKTMKIFIYLYEMYFVNNYSVLRFLHLLNLKLAVGLKSEYIAIHISERFEDE